VKQLRNVKVHSNECIAESADLANEVLGAMLPKLNDAKGTICRVDSTDRSLMPSSAFDLVFAGCTRHQLAQWFEFVISMKVRPHSNTPLHPTGWIPHLVNQQRLIWCLRILRHTLVPRRHVRVHHGVRRSHAAGTCSHERLIHCPV